MGNEMHWIAKKTDEQLSLIIRENSSVYPVVYRISICLVFRLQSSVRQSQKRSTRTLQRKGRKFNAFIYFFNSDLLEIAYFNDADWHAGVVFFVSMVVPGSKAVHI
jgi:hypothetical protein